MQNYLSCLLIPKRAGVVVAAGVLLAASLGSTGCGDNSAPLPSQYFRFKYSTTPAGLGTPPDSFVLAIADGSNTCDRTNKKIVVTGLKGAASASLTLVNTANAPFQTSLNLDYHTAGIAQLDLVLPLDWDANGVGSNLVPFTTAVQSQAVTCNFNIPEADFFARLNGTFTCASSQSAVARRIDLSGGTLVATPCQAGQ